MILLSNQRRARIRNRWCLGKSQEVFWLSVSSQPTNFLPSNGKSSNIKKEDLQQYTCYLKHLKAKHRAIGKYPCGTAMASQPRSGHQPSPVDLATAVQEAKSVEPCTVGIQTLRKQHMGHMGSPNNEPQISPTNETFLCFLALVALEFLVTLLTSVTWVLRAHTYTCTHSPPHKLGRLCFACANATISFTLLFTGDRKSVV